MYIDTHVHLYPGVSPLRMAKCARANLPDPQAPLALMLTERSGDHAFEELVQGQGSEDGVSVTPLQDGLSLRMECSGLAPVYWVSGRQIATSERMEVLALGTLKEFKDHQSLEETVAAVQADGAFAVIPWALGKWWFKRGRLLRTFLENFKGSGLALADSAMRPVGAPSSPLFSLARKKGLPIVAGTDPLPRPGEEGVAGMLGIQLKDVPAEATMTEDIQTAIQKQRFAMYGRRRSLPRVLASAI